MPTMIAARIGAMMGKGAKNEPEVDVYIEGLVTPLSDAQIADLNSLVGNMKTGLSVSLLSDVLYYFHIQSGETEESSLRNMVARTFDLTKSGSPVFTQFEGFRGVIASSSFLKTGFVPSVNSPLDLNDNTFGVYLRDYNTLSSSMAHGVWDNGNSYLLDILPAVSGVIRAHNNNISLITTGVSFYLGLNSTYRSAGNLAGIYSNLLGNTNAFASTGLPEFEMYLLARNKSGTAESKTDHQLSFDYLGKHLTQLQVINGLLGPMNQYLYTKGKNVDIISVFRWSWITDDQTNYQSFGNIAIDSNGKLYATYRDDISDIHGYSATGKAMMKVSTDSGITWSAPITIADVSNVDERGIVPIVFDDNGVETLMCVYSNNTGATPAVVLKKAPISSLTFGAEIDTTFDQFTGANPILLSNGKILVPLNQYVLETSDGGLNWLEYEIATAGSYSGSEPAIIEGKTGGVYTGRVIAIFRDTTAAGNLISYSADYGHTWTVPVNLAFSHNSVPALIRHYSGTLLLFITGYDAVLLPNNGLFVYKSNDEGATWTLFSTFGNAFINNNPQQSVVYMGNDHFAFEYSDNDPGSDTYVLDLIIDPSTL